MSVATTTPYDYEVGNGVKTAFDFAFKIFSTDDLVVYKETAAGVFTQQAIVPDWGGGTPDPNTCWVEYDTEAETGTVHYSSAVTDTLHSYIGRASSAIQSSSLPTDDPMRNKTIENALDKLTLMVQELKAQIARAPLAPETQAVPPTELKVAAPVDGAGVYWVADGADFVLTPMDISLADLQTALDTAVAAAAAATAAVAALAEQSGTLAARPAAPADAVQYYATDVDQLFRYSPAAAKWYLIG